MSTLVRFLLYHMPNMTKNQKSYTPKFKQQIVDRYNARGASYPQLEREYGVNRSTISGWVKQLSPTKNIIIMQITELSQMIKEIS